MTTYENIRELFESGDWSEGDHALRARLEVLYGRVVESNATDTDAAREFSESLFDAVVFAATGDLALATGVIFAVASFDSQVSLIGHCTDSALRFLVAGGGLAVSSTSIHADEIDDDDLPEPFAGLPEATRHAIAALSWLRASNLLIRSNCEGILDLVASAKRAFGADRISGQLATLEIRVNRQAQRRGPERSTRHRIRICPACDTDLQIKKQAKPRYSAKAVFLMGLALVVTVIWLAGLLIWSPSFLIPTSVKDVVVIVVICLAPAFVIGTFAMREPRVRTLRCPACDWRETVPIGDRTDGTMLDGLDGV